jgi:hypothetical protein
MKRIAILAIILGVVLAALAEAQHVYHWLGPTQGLSDVLAAAGLLLLAVGLWMGFRHQPSRA